MVERKSTSWPSVIFITFICILAVEEGLQCKLPGETVKMLKEVYCKGPVEVMESLPVPSDYDSVYPSVVKTKRCGVLVCPSTGYKCVAKRQMQKTITVNGRYISDGRLLTNCISISYPEDIECRCACDTKREHCGPNEIYDGNMCKCMCNPREERKCKESSVYMWESKTCTCKCTKEEECDSGSVWVKDACKCLPRHERVYPVGQ